MNAVAQVEPKRSLITTMANKYGMDAKAFHDTLRATVVPPNTSNEDFAAFLLVAAHYNLNPITKEIFAFPKRGGGIQPIVSVDGWANLINSHPECDGIEFADHLDDKGGLISITCKIYRKDRAHACTATEYMDECRRDTDVWKKWPRRMLRHKSLIQAARYAFGFSGIVDPDEAERFTAARNITPPPPPDDVHERAVAPSAAPSRAMAQRLAAPPPPPPPPPPNAIWVQDATIPLPPKDDDAIDPEALFKEAEETFRSAKNGADLERLFVENYADLDPELHHQRRLTPPDWDHLIAMYERYEAKLDPA
jgi:phage recombination protein Bet